MASKALFRRYSARCEGAVKGYIKAILRRIEEAQVPMCMCVRVCVGGGGGGGGRPRKRRCGCVCVCVCGGGGGWRPRKRRCGYCAVIHRYSGSIKALLRLY
jgi:hypothetical protein